MKLDTKSVLNKEQERKSKPIPLPSIKIGDKTIIVAPVDTPEEIISTPETKTFISETSELHSELSSLKRQRGKLSSQTAFLVQEVEKKLRAENPAIAHEFMKGNLPMPELAEHYKKIDALTMQATSVWDRIKDIEEHGSIPAPTDSFSNTINHNTTEIDKVNKIIRRYDDLIHKTKKKLNALQIGQKQKKNAGDWIVKYKETIAGAEENREVERKKLRSLQYDNRERRA